MRFWASCRQLFVGINFRVARKNEAHNATNTSHKRKKVERRRPDQRYLSGAPNGHARPVRSAAEQTRVQGIWVLPFSESDRPMKQSGALLKAHGPSIGDLHQKSTEPNSPLHKIRSHIAGSTVPAWSDAQSPQTYLKKEDSTVRLGLFAHGLIHTDHSIWHLSRPPMVRRHCKAVRDRSHACSNCLNLVDPLPE